ncbi:MAG: sensor histidine kinase [Saprospiraceae bacterium]|nr:sensor histidine kinase [Saprospiraceae bacterium]
MRHTLLIILSLFICGSLNGQENVPKSYSQERIDSLKIFCNGHYTSYNYFDALDCFLDLLGEYEGKEDLSAYYSVKIRLAWVYLNLGYVVEAQTVLKEAIEYFKNHSSVKAAEAHIYLAWILIGEGEIENARTQLNLVRRSQLRKLSEKEIVPYLITEARIQAIDKDSLKADEKLVAANKLCLKHDLPHWYAYVQYYMGQFSLAKNHEKEASKSFLKSAKVSRELGNVFLYKSALDELIPILGNRGNYDQAYYLQEERNRLSDSLSDLSLQEIISRQIVRYESDKKQKAILDLEGEKRLEEIRSRRSNLTNYALLISFLAVLVAAYLIINFYQQKLASNEIITSQKEQINQQKFIELRDKMQIESMQSMMKGQEFERERVAKDLHDSLGGMLSAIRLRFDGLLQEGNKVDVSEFNNITDLIDDACQEVRNISNNLQPGALEQLGLIEALTDLINKYERSGQTEIHFQHYGVMGNSKLDTFTSLNIYRIVQELINNSLKHAQAKEILVQLHRDNGQLVVMVEDDGKGYDPSEVDEGMGSENVRSRANFLDAELNIESSEGEGTSTMITIPLD